MHRFLTVLFLALTAATSAQAVSYFPPLEPPTYKSALITTATTTAAVVTGPGSLRAVCIDTPIAGGTVTIDDAITATNTIIGPITTPATAANPFCLYFNSAFYTGLTVVTTGAQAVNIVYQN